MEPMLVNAASGAGGAIIRSLLGWAKSRGRFNWKLMLESAIEGAISGALTPAPAYTALAGYAGSSIIGKVVRIPKRRTKLPDNK